MKIQSDRQTTFFEREIHPFDLFGWLFKFIVSTINFIKPTRKSVIPTPILPTPINVSHAAIFKNISAQGRSS
jgi:hypothetical protein